MKPLISLGLAAIFLLSACASPCPAPPPAARESEPIITRGPPPPSPPRPGDPAPPQPPADEVIATPRAAPPGDIVVPAPTRPIEEPPPPVVTDPRSVSERRADIRAWDRCVLQAQRAREPLGGANPVADDPEELCRKSLGMSGREAIPDSRRR